MRLARESRYAIEALVVLADAPPGEMMEAREIAALAHLPAAVAPVAPGASGLPRGAQIICAFDEDR
jgi:amidase